MRGDAIPFSVRPLVAAVLFGVLLGACGGGSSDSGHLEPSLGQGNADAIRAEYEATLKAAESGLSMMSAVSVPAVDVAEVTDGAGSVVSALGADGGVGARPLQASGAPQEASLTGTGPQREGISLSGASAIAQGGIAARHDQQVSKESPEGAHGQSAPIRTRAEALALAQPFHALARDVVEKVNAIRAQPQRCGDQEYPPAPPLTWNARVAYAALLESEWMVKHNTFSHQWEDGKYVWDRFDMARYAWSKADENIAAGFSTLDKAMQAWLESPSHCKAMMRPDIREIGLSVLPGREGSRYNSWWTMALGTPGY